MTVAFLTGALAASVFGAALSTAVIWLVTVLSGSAAAWGWAPPVIVLAALAFAVATFVAEEIAMRRTTARMQAHGEPWAYRARE